MSTRLEELGFTHRVAEALARLDAPALVPGRIVSEGRGAYRVATADGEHEAVLAGCRRAAAGGREELPAVGDWVALRVAGALAIVRHVLPRTTALVRRAAGARTEAQVVAANVDLVLVVFALDRPFRPCAAERALALARGSGAEAVLVLNKADLAAGAGDAAAAAALALPGVPVHVTSCAEGSGRDELRARVGHGRTAALLGPSGVGKSSLLNLLAGDERERTGEVRVADRRGRHTTTARALHLLPAGGCLVDTPGVRELGLWEGEAGIEDVFAELEERAAGCAFRDCSHELEPGCALLAAVAAGELDDRRVASYVKLRHELRALDRRVAGRARVQESRRARRRLRALRRRAEERD